MSKGEGCRGKVSSVGAVHVLHTYHHSHTHIHTWGQKKKSVYVINSKSVFFTPLSQSAMIDYLFENCKKITLTFQILHFSVVV